MQQGGDAFIKKQVGCLQGKSTETLMHINVQNIGLDFDAPISLEYLLKIRFLSSCSLLQLELNSNTPP